MSATDGTGDYGEDEGQDTWQPADTKLELQMKALEQGRTMSAFDAWWNTYEKDDSDVVLNETVDAFNAGLEAAAEIADEDDDTLAKLLERERLNIILQKKNEELEAERDRVMRENGKLNCHIDDLEEENKRLMDCAEKAANALVLEMPDAAMSYIKQALEETT